METTVTQQGKPPFPSFMISQASTTPKQGSQIRQIWRNLRQNCSDDSTEVTEGVTSTPEIFGNKQFCPYLFHNKYNLR